MNTYTFELTLTRTSPEPIGIFQSTKIYSWIDIKTKRGDSMRLFFAGITNEPDDFIVDNNCVLLSPGIIYKYQSEP